MNPIAADFRPSHARARWLTAIAAAITLAAAASMLWAWHERRNAAEARGDWAQAMARSDSSAVAASREGTKTYATSARELLAERTQAWPQVLDALEQQTSVAVLAIEFSALESKTRLEVGASDIESVLVLLEQMNRPDTSDGTATRRQPWSVSRVSAAADGSGMALRALLVRDSSTAARDRSR